MRNIKIIFEMSDDNLNLDVNVEKPEDFIAGIAYIIEQTCEKTGLDKTDAVKAISDVVLNKTGLSK